MCSLAMLAQPLTILSNRNAFFYLGKDKVTLLTMLTLLAVFAMTSLGVLFSHNRLRSFVIE